MIAFMTFNLGKFTRNFKNSIIFKKEEIPPKRGLLAALIKHKVQVPWLGLWDWEIAEKNRPMIAGSRPVPGPNFDANLKFWKCLKV